MKVNLPSDFIPLVIVLPTCYSGQNNVSLFKPTCDEKDIQVLDGNFFGRTEENIISMDLDEMQFEIGLKI